LDTIIDSIYFWIIDKQYKNNKIVILLIDIVSNVVEWTIDHIIWTSSKEYWYCMVSESDNKSWAILPDISWVADAKNALYLIKTKYNMEWKVKLYKFNTDRIAVNI
jgi:hypothetical protein